MNFGESSKTEAPLTQCIYAESFVLRSWGVQQVDKAREVSVFG